MNLSTVVRTSFVLSGFLSIRFDGIPDGNGGETIFETTVPFRIKCYNQLLPINVIRMASVTVKAGQVKPSQFYPEEKSKSFDRMNFTTPAITDDVSNSKKVQYSKPEPIITTMTPPIQNMSTTPSTGTITSEDFNSKGCGNFKCKEDEMCVSWKKLDDNETTTQINKKKVHSECHKNDGLHHPKVNPITSPQLCPDGFTHAIQRTFQPCLQDDPPCPLVWNYNCVEEFASPHNCSIKKCPGSWCVEHIICNDQPPCTLEAICMRGVFQ